jgi:hypothetical protein
MREHVLVDAVLLVAYRRALGTFESCAHPRAIWEMATDVFLEHRWRLRDVTTKRTFSGTFKRPICSSILKINLVHLLFIFPMKCKDLSKTIAKTNFFWQDYQNSLSITSASRYQGSGSCTGPMFSG